MKVVIVDYDTGNTHSLRQALENVGLKVIISKDPSVIQEASGIILPGVGAFPKAMAALKKQNLISPIKQAVALGTPLLGICLGMQLLFKESVEHEVTEGLNLIPGKVIPIPRFEELPIPHMGWNQLIEEKDSFLRESVDQDYVYYVHSYYADCPEEVVVASSDYGVKIPGLVNVKNVYGMQFHPEKSGDVGKKILKEFKKVVER